MPRPRPPEPEALPSALESRRQAGLLLEAALSRRGGLDQAAGTDAFRQMEPRDRAFARALALTVLRRLGSIDAALAVRLRSPPPEAVTTLLRLGLTQAWFMDQPAYAAVDSSVALAAASQGTRPFKGLVNAVLRAALRAPPPANDPRANAPDWLFARWSAAHGEAAALAIAAEIVREPATDLTCRDPADADGVAAALDGRVLAGGTVRTERRGDLAGWPGYDEGLWWVQDAAAAAPARLLAVQSGETALDLCAAPGGKALQLAAAGARVTALDRSASRLRRLTANLARTRLEAEVVVADALAWADDRSFDTVLLDAPCSATGTFRRNPDVLWSIGPGDIVKLAGVQAAMLDAAAERVRPGGRLVYCVCSLEPEEGEAQVNDFLARRPDFRTEPASVEEAAPFGPAVTLEGWLRILPSTLTAEGGCDGFFAARLVRRG